MEDLYSNYTSTSTNLSRITLKNYTSYSKQYLAKNIFSKLTLDRNASILDIGCGAGSIIRALEEFGYDNVSGFDLSQEQIETAKKICKTQDIQVSDAIEYLQETQKKYELIFMMDVLEHVEVDYGLKLLKLIKEKLSVGGHLIIQVPNGLSLVPVYFVSDVTHIKLYSPMSLKQLLLIANFVKINLYQPKFPIQNLKEFLANIMFNFFWYWITFFYVLSSTRATFGKIYSQNLLAIVEN